MYKVWRDKKENVTKIVIAIPGNDDAEGSASCKILCSRGQRICLYELRQARSSCQTMVRNNLLPTV